MYSSTYVERKLKNTIQTCVRGLGHEWCLYGKIERRKIGKMERWRNREESIFFTRVERVDLTGYIVSSSIIELK